MLIIPATSKAAVITTMVAISDAHEAKNEYDPSATIKAGRGAKVLIEDYTPQADVVYRVMESGMSLRRPPGLRRCRCLSRCLRR